MDFASLNGIYQELYTVLFAAMPIGELRFSIPFAYYKYQMPIDKALVWSLIGNMLPVFFVLLLINPIVMWLRSKIKLFKKIIDWWFFKIRNKHYSKFKKWGALALVSVVAIPLPGTGAWTGILVSYLFGIRYWQAVGLIFVGVAIAGIIVSGITLGVFSLQNINI